MDKPPLDPILYRDAMSRLAGHVHVVTASHEGETRGVTITAACSVSDAPPTLLVCLNASNPRNGVFTRAPGFALNLLGSGQRSVADRFSGQDTSDPDQRFAGDGWMTLETGAPVLKDAVATFDCVITEVKTVSTHLVVFGRVVALHLGGPGSALLYHARTYRDL